MRQRRETPGEARARREARLLGPTREQVRDLQVARETVRPRSECNHCNPGVYNQVNASPQEEGTA